MVAIRAVAAHNSRAMDTPNASGENVNRVLVGSGDVAKDVASVLPQKRRKNAVLARELYLSASPEFFDSPEKTEAWIEKATAFLKSQYNDKQLVSVIAHLDEKTPHIHAIVVPLGDNNKLCARSIWTKQTMKNAQSQYAEFCKPLGLKRGVEGSRARHEDIKDYAKRVNTPTLELPPLPPPVREKKGLFDGEHKQLIAEREQQIQEREIKVEEILKVAHAKSQEFDMLKSQKLERDRQFNDLRSNSVQIGDLPLPAVLESIGCQKDKNEWVTPAGRLALNGDEFQLIDSKVKGVGAIELLIQLEKCSSQRAIKMLAGAGFNSDLIASAAMKFAICNAEKPVFVQPLEGDFQRVSDWLTNSKRIPLEIVERMKKAGLVYADKIGNAVFRISNSAGRVVGVDVFSPQTNTFFRRGGRGLFKFDDRGRRSKADAEFNIKKKAVFVEDQLNAMAFAGLNPGALIIVPGRDSIVDSAKAIRELKDDHKIIAGFGRKPELENQSNVILREAGYGSERLKPDGENWLVDSHKGKKELDAPRFNSPVLRPRGPL